MNKASKIKIFIFNFIVIFTMIFLSYSHVFAVPDAPPVVVNPLGCETVSECVNRLSGFITPLAVLGFIACIIFAGFTRLTAAGNSDQEAKSMKIATGAAIGFAIITLAPLVVKLVLVY